MILVWNSPDHEITIGRTRREDAPYVVTDTTTGRQFWYATLRDAMLQAVKLENKETMV
jgi:hypothetical protein